jgi:CRISPR-associated protein Cmr5
MGGLRLEKKVKRTQIENGRARAAYDFVGEAKRELKSEEEKKYKSYIKKMAPLIKTNGLGNTIAFYFSKKEKSYDIIYSQLQEWLRKQDLLGEGGSLIEDITRMDSKKYRHLTIETLSLLNWWSRFVDGLINIV